MHPIAVLALLLGALYVLGIGMAALVGGLRREEAAAWEDDERTAGARMIVRAPLWPIDAARALRKSWQGLLEDARRAG